MLIDRLRDINIYQGSPLNSEFVFVVSFRNQENKIQRCLESITKNHLDESFGVILIDDNSDDNSFNICKNQLLNASFRNILIKNNERRYYTRNLYNAVNLLISNPETVVIEVDGDDYLENLNAISIVKEHYNNGALQTYGSFRLHSEPSTDREKSLAIAYTRNNSQDPWNSDECASWMHLKTFKKHLFMSVPLDYFLEKDTKQWLKMAEDVCVHSKMMEIAKDKVSFIKQIVYVHDCSGASHDALNPHYSSYVINKLFKCPRGKHFRQLSRINLINQANNAAK